MTAVAESAVPELDACAALRADLEARAEPGARGPASGDAVPGPEAPGDVERVAAWLPLVVGLERAARLPPRALPGHFRRQQLAWQAAADALGEARYAAIGARLARWRSGDPRLRLVKEVLWALEQPEAAGYTRLALAGMTALAGLVPADDLRSGYVLVQSARAVRTLGDSQGAVERYTLSERLGKQVGDHWLCMRSAVGLGTTHEYLGNYPAARVVFRSVLAAKPPDARFTAAAHHGLMISSMAAKDWDTALEAGWHLLQAGRSGTLARSEVLNLTAELCRRVGRYTVATRAAEVSLRIAFRPDHIITALQVLVDIAAKTGNHALGRRYGPVLRALVGGAAGPFEDARALLALAGLEHTCGSREVARDDLARARAIADALHYHELQFEAERIATGFADSSTPSEEAAYTSVLAEPHILLSGQSQRIVSRLHGWSEHDMIGSGATLSEIITTDILETWRA